MTNRAWGGRGVGSHGTFARTVAAALLASGACALAAGCQATADDAPLAAQGGVDPAARRADLEAVAPGRGGGGGGGGIPPVKPPVIAPDFPDVVFVEPEPPLAALPDEPVVCSPVRYDLRRVARSCEDLPGVVNEGGIPTLVERGGRFRIGRVFAGTRVPDDLARRACVFVWEPEGCSAPPVGRLRVTLRENLLRRPADCLTSGSGCRFATARWSTRVPSSIPNGPGRCEVCGYAEGRTLWAVLPPDYLDGNAFAYDLGGLPRAYVPLDTVELDGASVLAIELPVSVPAQEVSLMPSHL